MTRGLVVCAVLGVGLVACHVPTGLNRECVLVRKCDAGTCSISEQFVQEKTGSTKDFITFGAVECDDFVCVRDATFPKGTDLTAPAKGYCSKPCGGAGTACQSDDQNLDKKPATALSCRPLLLDAETLAVIKADPNLAAQVGNVTSPYFCARGNPDPDAGL